MTVKMSGVAKDGSLNVNLVHEQSGSLIKTTAPLDNGGDGSAFSPTDLLAASLAACEATLINLCARKNEISVKSVSFELQKEMAHSPRRVGKISVRFEIETDCSEMDFEKLVTAAKSCPVKNSLAENVQVEESFQRKQKA